MSTVVYADNRERDDDTDNRGMQTIASITTIMGIQTIASHGLRPPGATASRGGNDKSSAPARVVAQRSLGLRRAGHPL